MKEKDEATANEPIVCPMCASNDESRPRWGYGLWQSEPNYVAFDHAGLPCILHRNLMGSWSGYCAVPPGHSAHGKNYNDVDVDVHGGLSYSSPCREHIRHIPKPGEPDDVWWLGFDFGRAYDFNPRMGSTVANEHYWTVEEARAETERLAEQLAAMT